MIEAYPLSWPPGWPLTPEADRRDGRHQFRRPTASAPFWTFPAARDALINELRMLGAKDVVISSNFRASALGPVEGSRRPRDQAIAVYFNLDREPRVMARDSYTRAEENFRSLTLAIEAMRQLDRHGGNVMMKRAFQGFAALPAPRAWYTVLGVSPTASAEDIERAHRKLARTAHPDAGGSNAAMAELNAARDEGLRASL